MKLMNTPKVLIERDFPVEQLSELAQREGNKKKPIYEMHKWWARRLGSNIKAILIASNIKSSSRITTVFSQFYNPDLKIQSTVFDPFMGGGSTLIEASKLGAKNIGIDIDPVAWFISKKELEYCDPDRIRKEFQKIEGDVSKEIKKYYKTIDEKGNEVDVIYYFWVDVLKCPKCQKKFEVHPHYMLYESKKTEKRTVFCRKCHYVREIPFEQSQFKCKKCDTFTTVFKGNVKNGTYTCPYCTHSGKVITQIKNGRPLTKKLFALEYLNIKGERIFSKVSNEDLRRMQKATKEFKKCSKNLLYPKDQIPHKERTDMRPITHGYKNYYELFNERQLLCLSILYQRIAKVKDQNIKQNLLLAFSDCLASNNMMCGYAFGYRKLTPLFSIHSYRNVTRPVEGNVWGAKYGRGTFTRCVKKLIRAKKYAEKPYEIKYTGGREKVYLNNPLHGVVTTDIDEWTQGRNLSLILNSDSGNINNIKAKTINIILTDPPYYDNLAYSELSDFYYVWLKKELKKIYPKIFSKASTPMKETIMVKKNTDNEHNNYKKGLIKVFKNCSRVLKDDGLMIFTYHHKKQKAWIALGQSLLQSGFDIVNVFPIRSEGKSGFHSDSGNIKWDSVFVCRKSNSYRINKLNEKKICNQVGKLLEKWDTRLKKSDIILSEVDLKSLKSALILYKISENSCSSESLEKIFQYMKSNKVY